MCGMATSRQYLIAVVIILMICIALNLIHYYVRGDDGMIMDKITDDCFPAQAGEILYCYK